MTQKNSSFNEKKGGGIFATMGLSAALVRAVHRLGFRLPTPIQRKCIPLLLDGRDVVGMARTGSGKTAAFLLPLVHHLGSHSVRVGIRALVIAPTRELVIQIHTVLRDLLQKAASDLRTVALVGGEGVEEQFVQLASNPDIIIATPGRLMHICEESGLCLRTVQLVVWDEADRLVEDAVLAQQMREINSRLPSEGRQTALFSATLPSALVEFAQAGLKDPQLVRLDVESKLSPDLELLFLATKSDQKEAALLSILRHLVDSNSTGPSNDRNHGKTVIFAATKHHVEYLQELLKAQGMNATYIYGALDQAARRLALEQFRKGQRSLLIVTDVAARGLDIPLLDNVINYDFPSSPKLFLHRVGRVARAGRSGRAISLFAPDEYPFLFDLQLFLGRSVVTAKTSNSDGDSAMVIGEIPQSLLDEEQGGVERVVDSGGLDSLKKVMMNATKLYRKTRPTASPESHRRSKEFMAAHPILGVHPIFKDIQDKDTVDVITALHKFKPRSSHLAFLKLASGMTISKPVSSAATKTNPQSIQQQSKSTSSSSITTSSEPCLRYTKNEHGSETERGYALAMTKSTKPSSIFKTFTGFAEEARSAVMDLNKNGDDPSSHRDKRRGLKDGKASISKGGKLKSATNKRDNRSGELYRQWRAKTHLNIQRPGEIESTTASNRAKAIIKAGEERRRWRQRKPSKRPRTTK